MAAARKPKMQPERDKISAEFAARLSRSPSDTPLRSIVLLEIGGEAAVPKRPSRMDRKAAVARVKEAARSALTVVDDLLERLGGRRLSPSPDALGSIRVEATPEGLYRLAHLKQVRAVLEDQGIAPLPRPEQ
jgi:hypothetical protein